MWKSKNIWDMWGFGATNQIYKYMPKMWYLNMIIVTILTIIYFI